MLDLRAMKQIGTSQGAYHVAKVVEWAAMESRGSPGKGPEAEGDLKWQEGTLTKLICQPACCKALKSLSGAQRSLCRSSHRKSQQVFNHVTLSHVFQDQDPDKDGSIS